MSERNLPKERALEAMSKYRKEALANSGENEVVRTYTDVENRISVCFREKIHECPNCEDYSIEETWGIARCNPGDVFNKTIGEYLAIKRARGGKVPKTIRPFI